MATFAQSTSSFPADWNAIADEIGPFSYDPMHFPFPISPLMASASTAFCEGHIAGLRSIGIPERSFDTRIVNHYRYDRMVMEPPPADPDAAAQAGRQMEQTVQAEMARMFDRWFGEHLPRLRELDERLRQMHPRGERRETVLAMLDEADAIDREAWEIHFKIAPLMLLAMQVLREMHGELFEDGGDGALTVMAGGVTESIKAGYGLADLAQRARELGLASLILSTPVDVVMAYLRESDEGRAFLVDLDAYLDAYGLRLDLFDFATPTWREKPEIALSTIRSYLETGYDARAEHAAISHAAETAFEAARERLATYPEAVWAKYEQLVQLGRQGAFLQEEHNFYIDQRILSLLRLFYLEVGEELMDRGLLDHAEDVFMLHLDEVGDLIGRDDPPGSAAATRELVDRRRDELAQAATMTPPPIIGEPSAPPPDSVIGRALTAFFGGPPQAAVNGNQLQGTPGSRGTVSGPARVARTLDEARSVQPGEILVTVTTMPAWTPLFGTAAAVVTETGGPLSHCAVVAREYGIPAVVGAQGATRAIEPGQLVTVDGTSGVVTIGS